MKTIVCTVLLLATSLFAFAQSQDVLSPIPTTDELTALLLKTGRGETDPFLALPLVIARKDNAISGLSGVLAMSALPATADSTDSAPLALHKNKVYAVMALEAIGTKAAYTVLFQAAQSQTDNDVRGIALNALATTFHADDYLQRFTPDKEIVHLLLQNVDDTTVVAYYQKSFGQIAREGLISWMGQDYGEPQGSQAKARRLDGTEGTQTYQVKREVWWQANGSNMVWNDDWGRFRRRGKRVSD